MIQASYQRLGSIVLMGVIDKLTQPFYQVLYREVMGQYQSNAAELLYFQSGKPKLQNNFPCVGVELVARKDKWAALSHTKEIELNLEFTIAVKALTGQKSMIEDPNVPGDISETEHYVADLSELLLEILNEPLTLQYTLTKDQDGNPLNPPLQIFDSLAEEIQYGYLYNGALRIGKIPWFGSIIRLGPSGGSGFFNPPAPA